jgi:hypothetical protein
MLKAADFRTMIFIGYGRQLNIEEMYVIVETIGTSTFWGSYKSNLKC